MKAKKLVTLWERPSYDGNGFTYYLLYTDETGKRRQKSLGHADKQDQPNGSGQHSSGIYGWDR